MWTKTTWKGICATALLHSSHDQTSVCLQAAGLALAAVLFGEYNPAGRLTQTWYPRSYVEQAGVVALVPLVCVACHAVSTYAFNAMPTCMFDLADFNV